MDGFDGFRRAQQLAYACVEEVGAGLAAGTTEREAAARMRSYLAARGVREHLHAPFAWFGDRAAFRGFKTPLAFYPTRRRLAPGMAYILDCAPVLDGFTADVGYTGWLGHNAIAQRLMDDLVHHRALVVDAVAARTPIGTIYEQVAALAAKQGYTIEHRAYPFGVIGHRVAQIPTVRSPLARISLGGFGLRSLLAFAGIARAGGLALWNGRIRARDPLPPGAWAVEPHLAFRGVGAKFEEILIVEDSGAARWLDDDLPHVRRWRALEAA